jgi:hypothetical protein
MTHRTFGAFKRQIQGHRQNTCRERWLKLYTNRDLALIAAFAALYTVWGFASSVTLQPVTFSADLFFLIAALFAVLASIVRKSWSATILGTIVGLVFLGTPAPNVVHITISLIANGVVFDAYLRVVRLRYDSTSRVHIIIAATLGNLVMAVIGLSAFQATGTSFSLLVWSLFVLGTGALGTLGAAFGLIVVKRVRVLPTSIRARRF